MHREAGFSPEVDTGLVAVNARNKNLLAAWEILRETGQIAQWRLKERLMARLGVSEPTARAYVEQLLRMPGVETREFGMFLREGAEPPSYLRPDDEAGAQTKTIRIPQDLYIWFLHLGNGDVVAGMARARAGYMGPTAPEAAQ